MKKPGKTCPGDPVMPRARWLSPRTSLVVGVLALTATLAITDPAAADTPAPAAAQANTVKLPDGPASVRGLGDNVEVSLFTGQVQYGVPFALPTGRAGFGPSLGLGYSGDLGNGPVGVGWGISHSAITRSVRHGVPTYSDGDEFEISGLGSGRLVNIDDGPFAGEYRVEGSGNSLRVQREFNRWIVTDSDGTKFYFGLSENSRQATDASGGRDVYAWYPELAVHRSGEVIYFDYLHDRGAVYLQKMRWGPDERFQAVLEYTGRMDPVTSYRQGFEVVTAKLLDRVRILSQGVELSAYQLYYERPHAPDSNGAPLNRNSLTRLSRVTMTGFLGKGELPTLSFSYAPPERARVREVSGLDGWELEERGVTFFDVDGDGADDLYRMEMGNHEYRRNLGGRFGPRQRMAGATAYELGQASFMDLDGDARPELVRIVDDTWRYSTLDNSSGTPTWVGGTEWPGTYGLPLGGPASVMADVNGDGRTDVIQGGTGGLIVTLNGPTGMQPTKFLGPIDDSNVIVEPGQPNVKFTDVNGDGLVDVAWLNDAWMKVYLGRGDGTFKAWRRVFYPWTPDVGPVPVIDVANLRLADLNRDGLLDLVRFTAANVLYYPGRAAGGFEKIGRHVRRPEDAAYDSVVALADANANGSTDIVWSSPRGMWVMDLAGATSAGMLDTIDNGLGKVTTVAYQASAVLARQDEQSGDAWSRKLPISIPIPVRTTVDVGDGSPLRVVENGVRDGFYDGEERRFGGFLESRQSVLGDDPSKTAVTFSTYHAGLGQDRVLRGQTVTSRVENGLGVVNTTAETLWETVKIEDLPDHPLLRAAVSRETRTYHHEGVAEPFETLSWVDVDGQGRVIAEHDRGRLDLTNDESSNFVRYMPDDTEHWIRNRTCRETVMQPPAGGTCGGPDDLGCALVSDTETVYGELSGPVFSGRGCDGDLGEGLPRETRGFLDQQQTWAPDVSLPAEDDPFSEAAWIALTTTEYDEFWNPTGVWEAGVERTMAYDEARFRVESESVSPNTQTVLTWTMAWDDVRGLAKSVTGPEGVTTSVDYDELGRLLSMANRDRPAHVVYTYDWVPPSGHSGPYQPKTTTYVFDGDDDDLVEYSAAAPGWRETVAIANGAGEPFVGATRLSDQRWIISGLRERDAKGRTRTVYESFYWNGVDPRAVTLPGGGSTPRAHRVEYDAFDRVVEQVAPGGETKTLHYSAFCQSTSSPELAPVTSCQDGLDRVLCTERVVDDVGASGVGMRCDDGPSAAPSAEWVTAEYDAAGRLLAMNLDGNKGVPDGGVTHAFQYDSLGRLVYANDPDIGRRWIRYNDYGQLRFHRNGEDQVREYQYDDAGRLTLTRGLDASGTELAASKFEYRYDSATGTGPHAPYEYTMGRLAEVIEPTGNVVVGYDIYGRQIKKDRTIDGKTAGDRVTYSSSGLVLEVQYTDDFNVSIAYDRAGRGIGILGHWYESQSGNMGSQWLWNLGKDPFTGEAVSGAFDSSGADMMDAAGRVLAESYGNGVEQTYGYDANGKTDAVRVYDARGNAVYDVGISRNVWGGIVDVVDRTQIWDANGSPTTLDQTAHFDYDGAARLTRALLGDSSAEHRPGTAPGPYEFNYAYDGLQNMIERTQSNGAALQTLKGVYRYAEAKPGGGHFGPRQLSSIAATADGEALQTFEYDGAGRMVRQDDLGLVYNGLDQLVEVNGLPNGSGVVRHAYGYDGQRVRTVDTDGNARYWFTPSVSERDGVREHYVMLGSRVIVRVSQNFIEAQTGGGAAAVVDAVNGGQNAARWLAMALLVVALGVMAWVLLLGWRVNTAGGVRAGPRGLGVFGGSGAFGWARSLAAATALASMVFGSGASGCGLLLGETYQPSYLQGGLLYFHTGVSPGPVVFTNENGERAAERRFEPFGEEIDELAGAFGVGQSRGGVDFATVDWNSLNKQTDPDTGWSYHGARWMVPETARWTAPDPPVKAPLPHNLVEPWRAHPYFYVEQNPVVHWDPDGRDKVEKDGPEYKANFVDLNIVEVTSTPDANGNHHTMQVHYADGRSMSVALCRIPVDFPQNRDPDLLASGYRNAQTHFEGLVSYEQGSDGLVYSTHGDGRPIYSKQTTPNLVAFRTKIHNIELANRVRLEMAELVSTFSSFVGGLGGAAGATNLKPAPKHSLRLFGQRKAVVPRGKWKYIFGRATGKKNAGHNKARTGQNGSEMSRLGVPDTDAGKRMLSNHFSEVVQGRSNVVSTTRNRWGLFEKRESVLHTPGGAVKLTSTWRVQHNGDRVLTTVIPTGGPGLGKNN